MRKIVIAMDGYSACGKSTTARIVASILGYRYVDSGAMYRAVTLYFLDNHISLTNPKEVDQALAQIHLAFHINSHAQTELFMNGVNIEKSIRKMRISENVSPVSAMKQVRHIMVEQQRKMGKDKGIVMDGRDIGTVVFPDAELKFFLTADIHVRAYRRQQELLEKDKLIDLNTIIDNLTKRDYIDSNRQESPLVRATGAIEMDTTYITLDEQVDEVVRIAMRKIVS